MSDQNSPHNPYEQPGNDPWAHTGWSTPTRPEDDWNSGWSLPNEEPTFIPEFTPAKKTSWARRAIGGLVLGAVVAGGVTAYEADNQDSPARHSTPTPEMTESEQTQVAPAELQQAPLPVAISKDFEHALKHDDCTTKVTAEQVGETYQRLFGFEKPTAINDDQLSALAQDKITELEQARSAAGYIALPENFANLQENMTNNTIPTSEYVQAVINYGESYGVPVLFDWKPNVITDFSDNSLASPVSQAELQNSKIVRTYAVSIMSSLSRMSPQRASEAIKRIAVGDMVAERDQSLGQALSDGTILFDVPNGESLTTEERQYNTETIAALLPHETAHTIDSVLCISLFNSFEDKAYDSLNDQLKYIGTQDATYALDGNTPSVEIARAYGSTNIHEDIATAFGEVLLHGQSIDELFADGRDTTVLKEKIALIAARDAVQHPADESIYAQQAQLALIQAELRDRNSRLNNQYFDVFSRSTYSDPLEDPAVLELETQMHKYDDIIDSIDEALN